VLLLGVDATSILFAHDAPQNDHHDGFPYLLIHVHQSLLSFLDLKVEEDEEEVVVPSMMDQMLLLLLEAFDLFVVLTTAAAVDDLFLLLPPNHHQYYYCASSDQSFHLLLLRMVHDLQMHVHHDPNTPLLDQTEEEGLLLIYVLRMKMLLVACHRFCLIHNSCHYHHYYYYCHDPNLIDHAVVAEEEDLDHYHQYYFSRLIIPDSSY
jgi:hypothetical protein